MIRHHSYIIPGLVDGAVVRKQAEQRRDDPRHPEATFVHEHQEGSPCKLSCTMYVPGYYPTPAGQELIPMEEE